LPVSATPDDIIATSYQQPGQGDYTLTIREFRASESKN
jgi:hypothetical protein